MISNLFDYAPQLVLVIFLVGIFLWVFFCGYFFGGNGGIFLPPQFKIELKLYILSLATSFKKTMSSEDIYNDGTTVLMLACINSTTTSSVEAVRALIKVGVDLEKQNTDGWTALMMACRYSTTTSSAETVRALIKAKADLEKQNTDGWTALMMACRHSGTDSNIETVRALIKAKADLNNHYTDGWTALTIACRYSRSGSSIETVRALIEAKADLEKQTTNGNTALTLACRNSRTTSSIETVRALIEAGADLEKRVDNKFCWDYLESYDSTQLLKYYNNFIEKKKYGDECIICTELLIGNIVQLTCRHKYHLSCLIKVIKKECPICRYSFG